MIYRIKPENKLRIPICVFIILACLFAVVSGGCSAKPPMKIQDLSYVMPGDDTNDYDVYKVIAVKKDVNNQDLVGLMEYFTKTYIDKNRVMIYVFNSPGAPHTGETSGLVATYFQDKEKKQFKREILLDMPR